LSIQPTLFFQQVSSSDLKQGVVTSAEQLLQSKVAGLSVVQGSGDPASGATVRLRGGLLFRQATHLWWLSTEYRVST